MKVKKAKTCFAFESLKRKSKLLATQDVEESLEGDLQERKKKNQEGGGGSPRAKEGERGGSGAQNNLLRMPEPEIAERRYHHYVARPPRQLFSDRDSVPETFGDSRDRSSLLLVDMLGIVKSLQDRNSRPAQLPPKSSKNRSQALHQSPNAPISAGCIQIFEI